MNKINVTLAIAFLTLSTPAMAYLDPGSGSAIMSALVGFFVGITMMVKSYWYKLKSLFPSSQNTKTKDTLTEEHDDKP